MTPAIRREFLAALHRAFGALDYGVIGGTALAEYGNQRATSDIDVIIPHRISEVVDGQLLANGLVRTVGGGIGYAALAHAIL
jgi:predicted nucleotidyltransferase